MNDTSREGTRGRTVRHAARTLSLMTVLLLPLVLGARDCERVVVGEECGEGPCAGTGGSSDGGTGGCLYEGKRYAAGESFPSADGCNSCGCSADGQVACTLRACDNSCGGLLGRGCPASQYCKYPEGAFCGAADQTGVCTVRPQGCREIYQPVCGCDGKDYGNECEAATAGTSVASQGQCKGGGDPGATCGGLIGQPCPRGQYCNFPTDAMCGRADATGTCANVPQACTLEYSPVCGCDGMTYGNACGAASAGVSVETRGECGGGGTGQSCGSRGQAPCARGQYCNFPIDAECGATDRPGTCAEIPQACTREYNPVCGCDGMTYGNPCMAAAAGVAVAARGECMSTGSGATCGGIAGARCPDGEYCNFPVSARCGAADQTGTCATIPDACDAIYQPVCGCDDRTYGNACEAASKSVSVSARGECGGGGKTCGGLIGAQCAADEYCDYPADAICGRADATGTCKPRPDSCIEVEMPVCGCDGKTYGNACKAMMAGVSVETDAACN